MANLKHITPQHRARFPIGINIQIIIVLSIARSFLQGPVPALQSSRQVVSDAPERFFDARPVYWILRGEATSTKDIFFVRGEVVEFRGRCLGAPSRFEAITEEPEDRCYGCCGCEAAEEDVDGDAEVCCRVFGCVAAL